MATSLISEQKMAENENNEAAILTFKEALHAQSEVVHSKCNPCTR